MKRKEAIWILENRDKDGNLTGMIGGYKELLDVCLEALKQQESQEDEIYDNLEGYAEKVDIIGESPIWVRKPAQPEIIRCRECKHMQKDEIFHQCWCNGNEVKEDHFCGYAERKEDE